MTITLEAEGSTVRSVYEKITEALAEDNGGIITYLTTTRKQPVEPPASQ
jgi:hypothetical protein